MRVFNLPMAKGYVSDWGLQQGVRELLQNSIDSESPFCCEYNDGVLQIKSEFSSLTVASLLLGTTDKRNNNDKIGSFGEGYKLALLVLTRLGYKVVVYNGAVIWTPKFVNCDDFDGAEIFCVEETEAHIPNKGLTFSVHGLTNEDYDEIVESCLLLQPADKLPTSFGSILLDKPGKLYSGGLFVQNLGHTFKYGYDIKPDAVSLDRDRQSANIYEVQRVTTNMWFETSDMDLIVANIRGNLDDVGYAAFSPPEAVSVACWKYFEEHYKGRVIATSAVELEELAKIGLIAYTSDNYFSQIVRDTDEYKASIDEMEFSISTVQEELEKWLEENGQHMQSQAKEAFQSLVTKAEEWNKCA